MYIQLERNPFMEVGFIGFKNQLVSDLRWHVERMKKEIDELQVEKGIVDSKITELKAKKRKSVEETEELKAKRAANARRDKQIAKRQEIVANCAATVKAQQAYIKRVSQPRNR